MDDKKKELLEGLTEAIRAERDGNSFYRMAAKGTEDEKGKEIFETLANEELDHMHFLRRQYDSIMETGVPDMTIKLGPKADLSGLSPIFSDKLKSRIKDAHIEMSALSIGVQLELDAIKFYQEQSKKADDPEIKRFYDELAEWEQGHYNALLAQQKELRKDYWSDSGFAPF